MRVLVGYATAHGSTREIAERIARVLDRAGLRADARPLEAVDDADDYDAFVLGSAVHGQRWLAPARDFLSGHLELLAARPVWLFSVGMPGALRGPWKRLAPLEGPAILRGLPGGLSYRAHRLLSGVILPSQLPRGGRIRFRLMGCRYGDHRDWDAIKAWAAGIADELRA
ncbi:flavodoxin [Streptomyces sp. NBRC 14336]|uniref:flavodoxin domain-containing protein n=1 Tax=Streptomyces sp. NBRC 14336 TaxID=3030992 RepID=UPI0024A078B3|nr:flavodoxin domain-containing protein [Streptomyces sp. NBRC 14336]WBO76092.1 flavodoxin domain-containing protein [Streptomyces sp. SBE_14.2]GLW50343.1 flavodoxin [Streptomyces sp. NBRC 14336]